MLVGVTGSSPLLLLAVLACPVGMGLMMVFMGRGMRGGMTKKEPTQREEEATPLVEMKAEQARLAQKIEALESRESERKTEQSDEREANPVRR